MKGIKVLLVEDERAQAAILKRYLSGKGMEVSWAQTAKEARDLLKRENFHVMLLDLRLPDEDGMKFLEEALSLHPLLQVVVITAFATVESAVEAVKKGAYYYLRKPLNLEELVLLIRKAFEELRLKSEVRELRERLREFRPRLPEGVSVVAESSEMKEVIFLATKVAATDATVLLLGESGSGKEVVANLIHALSPRKDGPFVKVNCAALPETLLESELFGYEKGAFTGATSSKMGLFEVAHGGTIFLDEVGDMPLAVQAKLLRVLQEKRVRRLGSTSETEVDVRIIAATNRDLQKMVREGTFREDLFWRLNVFNIRIPPLRERKEDILPLAELFLKKFSEKYGKEVKRFSKEAIKLLWNHDFPGNVRELENLVERAVILAEGEEITPSELSGLVQTEALAEEDAFHRLPLPEAVELLEKTRIKKALEAAKGVKTRAAELLGISERVLRYKLEKYGLE